MYINVGLCKYYALSPSVLNVSDESWELNKCTINGPLYTVYAIHHRTSLQTHTHYMYTVSVDGRHLVSSTSIPYKHIVSHIYIWHYLSMWTHFICRYGCFVCASVPVYVCLLCKQTRTPMHSQSTHAHTHTHTHKHTNHAHLHAHTHMYICTSCWKSIFKINL